MFPLQELLEDESNQLFFGEVGKQMVIGLMTKAEKVGSLKVAYVSCGHRDTATLEFGEFSCYFGSSEDRNCLLQEICCSLSHHIRLHNVY